MSVGVTETFVDTITCEEEGALYEITLTDNLVEHLTAFEDGRVHVTFTQAGTFSAEPVDPTGQGATRHFAIWGGFNQNNKSVNGTFTFNVTGQFDDGSRPSVHAVDHFYETPTGAEFFFTRCRA